MVLVVIPPRFSFNPSMTEFIVGSNVWGPINSKYRMRVVRRVKTLLPRNPLPLPIGLDLGSHGSPKKALGLGLLVSLLLFFLVLVARFGLYLKKPSLN